MKKIYLTLNIYYKTALWAFLATLLIFVGTCCFYFLAYPDIPNGLLLGSLIGILSYVILGMIHKKEIANKKSVGAIIVSIARFVLLATILLLAGWLYYEKSAHIFNIFAILGGYLIPLVCLLILTVMEKKEVTNV